MMNPPPAQLDYSPPLGPSGRAIALRLVLGVVLLGPAAFCVFGFLASFEFSGLPGLLGKIGYAAVGVTLVALTGWLFYTASSVLRRARP